MLQLFKGTMSVFQETSSLDCTVKDVQMLLVSILRRAQAAVGAEDFPIMGATHHWNVKMLIFMWTT